VPPARDAEEDGDAWVEVEGGWCGGGRLRGRRGGGWWAVIVVGRQGWGGKGGRGALLSHCRGEVAGLGGCVSDGRWMVGVGKYCNLGGIELGR